MPTESLAHAAPSILVINVCRIGDTLLATPAIRAIAAAYPGCRITCLGHPKRAEVLHNLPFVQRVGTITKNRAPFLGRLGGRRHDCAFVYGFDQALVAYALRVADKVVAFRQKDAALNSRLHRCVEPPASKTMHAVQQQLLLPQAIGIRPAGLQLAYRVSEREDDWAKRLLRERLPTGAGPLVGLQVASFPTKAYRDWPIGHFISLCERIAGAYPGAHFLVLGGAPERRRTEELHRRFAHRSTLLAGKLSLRQTAAVMNQLDLYVGVDTGPTHIMGALHRPMVALYHCNWPSRLLAPLSHPLLRIVDHPGPATDGQPEAAMEEIAVERVWGAVQAALAGARHA